MPGHAIPSLDLRIQETEEDYLKYNSANRDHSPNKLLRESLDDYFNADDNNYIFTGLKNLDELTGGFSEGGVVVIGGSPCMGKTSFCLNVLMHNASNAGIPSLYIGLDEKKSATLEKMLCLATSQDIFEFKSKPRDIKAEKTEEFFKKYADAKLWLNFLTELSPADLHHYIRDAVEKHRVKIIVIDSIKALATYWSRREPRCVEAVIIMFLESLAKKYNCIILVTAPLSVTGNEKENHRPTLKDKALHSTFTDVALLLYRPEIHIPESSNKNMVEIIVAHNQRTHRAGSVMASFDPHKFIFGDGK